MSLFNTALCLLGIFSCSSIALAAPFNGPTDLSAQEFKELIINGPSTLNKIKAESLSINGPLNFNQLRVIDGESKISGPTSGEDGEFKDLVIHGSFWGTRLKIENLHVDGEVTIEDFKISGNVDVNGPLKAKNGSFNNINSVQIPVALYNVNVNNINVKKKNSSDNNRDTETNNPNNEVKLAGNTIVSGDITFESGNGVVFIRDKTAQLKGKVIGGKIRENY